jgi:hypothetical protein
MKEVKMSFCRELDRIIGKSRQRIWHRPCHDGIEQRALPKNGSSSAIALAGKVTGKSGKKARSTDGCNNLV